ncbi:PHP domain-containing protein [Chloroflexota bacterium]
MPGVDLHLHSTASDGLLSPEEIVHRAVELGLNVIALADHDTVEGIPLVLASAGNFPRLTVIPAVETSTDLPRGEAHVLGYFIDYTDPDLLARLESMRDSRRERAQNIIAKLGNLGINIEWERVQEIAGDGSMGRPHIARAMLEKGYIPSIKEAFTSYISRGGVAYAERQKMTPVEAVQLILRAKGLPVLAHPFTMEDPEAMVVELKAAGLIGVEVYYSGYTVGEIGQLVGLAEKYNLIATGGSDYHGQGLANEVMMGAVDVPLESVERLIALAKERGLRLY